MKVKNTVVIAIIAAAAAALALGACSRGAASGAGQPGGESGAAARTAGERGSAAASGTFGSGSGSGAGGRGGSGASSGQGGSYANGGGRRQVSVPVQVTTIPAGTLLADRDTAGLLSPVLQSSIAAPVSGIVAKVLRGAGDWVSAGTTVVQLDEAPFRIALSNAQAAVDTARINLSTAQNTATDSLPRLQLQVDSAQASVNSAQRSYESQKALYDLGGISASALDLAAGQLATAKANLESAKLALDQGQKGIASTPSQNVDALKVALVSAQNGLEQARYNFDHASIKAPFDGQIATMNANPGMYLGQNSPAFVLVSSSKQVSFGIAPSDAAAVRPGMRMSWETGGASYPIVLKQAPSNPVNGVVPLTATLLAPVALPFGSIGNVSYLIELAKGPIVPLTAVETIENRNFIFVVQDGKVRTVDVAVIAESGILAAVSGAKAGMEVVLSPPPGLVAGASVQALPTPFPESSALRLEGGQAAPSAPSQPGQPAPGQRSGQRQGSGGSGQGSGRRGGGTGQGASGQGSSGSSQYPGAPAAPSGTGG